MPLPFLDRHAAGKELAQHLAAYRDRPDVVVLALPRGGVPVGYEVAAALDALLDVFLVRKLGVPGQEELAFGAIASGGVRILNYDVIAMTGMSDRQIEAVAQDQQRELMRREREYREGRPFPDVRGKVVVLVDDGLATGATMLAAVRAVRKLGPAKVVVAVPVAARETCDFFARELDEIHCLYSPEPFQAVGAWYDDFSQTTDEEVNHLLARRAQSYAPSPAS
jgi:predicted phosphoribosyltransferase